MLGRLIVVLCFTGLLAGEGKAITISGVEFSAWEVIEVPGGVDVSVTTPGDLYLFLPEALFSDRLTLEAVDTLVIENGVMLETNDPLLCDAGCELRSFDEAGDRVVLFPEPVGEVTLRAQNIVVSTAPIPEPTTLLLVALGLCALPRRAARSESRDRIE